MSKMVKKHSPKKSKETNFWLRDENFKKVTEDDLETLTINEMRSLFTKWCRHHKIDYEWTEVQKLNLESLTTLLKEKLRYLNPKIVGSSVDNTHTMSNAGKLTKFDQERSIES